MRKKKKGSRQQSQRRHVRRGRTDGRTGEREGWEWDQTPFRSAVVLQKQRRQLRVQLHDVIHSP